MDMQPAFAMSDSSVDIIDLTVASEVDKVIASHVNKKNTEGFVSLDAKAEAPRHRDRKDEPLSPKSSGSGTSSQSRRSRDGKSFSHSFLLTLSSFGYSIYFFVAPLLSWMVSHVGGL